MPKAYRWNFFTKYYGHHTNLHYTTKETPLTMLYGADAMLPVEIDTPSWQCSQFDQKVNKAGLKRAKDLIKELREVTHVKELSSKHRASRRYKSNVRMREMRQGDLVLK